MGYPVDQQGTPGLLTQGPSLKVKLALNWLLFNYFFCVVNNRFFYVNPLDCT